MKTAAIWARVSGPGQRELSLESQTERNKAILEGRGYVLPPERILKVDWSSPYLDSCPQFQELRRWIRAKQIQALGVLDRDRLECAGLQRLIFLAECKEAGVELVVCQGPPILDAPEGQLVELALAIGKERQVMRAQQGAKDGLHDRATLRGLPPAPKNPYGYTWDKARTRLIPNSNWQHAQSICRAGLEGWPLRRIMKELYRREVLSPMGKEWWPPRSIHWILSSPIYGGRLYALRQEKVEPLRRQAETYGKTSGRVKPLSESILLPYIVVESPPLTWEEWLAVQERLKANKLQAQRNGKRDYLLRSIILCDTHHRRYHGEPQNSGWRYVCSARSEPGLSPCPQPQLPGPKLEERVKAICQEVLATPEIIEREIRQRAGRAKATLESVQRALAALDKKEARNRDTEANLVMEKATGKASPEAYERCLALVKAERAWIAEERQRLQAQLGVIQQGEATLLGLAQMRERLVAKLGSAANEDWRLVFSALALEVHVAEQGAIEVGLAIPVEKSLIVLHTPGHPPAPGTRHKALCPWRRL